jgi:hypothetical protein
LEYSFRVTDRSIALPPAGRLGPDTVALAALWVLVLVAPQLLAGVYPWGMLAIASCALIALATALRTCDWQLPALRLLDVAVLSGLVCTVLQTLPLPCDWMAALAPESVRDLRRVHALLAMTPPETCALSRDPGATREEVVKGVAIVAAYFATRILVQRGRRRAVVLAVVGSGVLLALVTLVHSAAGAETVFGIYAPLEIRNAALFGPVLNVNSLGGLLAMCATMLVGLGLGAERGRERVMLLAATLVTTATLLLTRSRGAVGGLALGLLVLGLLVLWRRRRRRKPSATSPGTRLARLGMPVAVVVALAITVLGTYAELADEFRRGGLDKLQLIARSVQMAAQHPWLGVGRGAFSAAFAETYQGPVRFDHAENVVVQWAAEWGFPVAAVLSTGSLLALVRAARRARSWHGRGVLAGVIALAAQNFVDLGLELVGIAAVAAVALAAATAEREPRQHSTPRAQASAAALVGALMAAVALLWVPIQRDHLPDADRALRTLLERSDVHAFRARLRPALLAHPGSAVLAVLGASEATQRDESDVLAWINHSQVLAPGWAVPHMLAAQWLWNHGHRDQALLELSAAARVDLVASRHLTCAIATRDPVAVIGIADRTGNAERFLELASKCVGRQTAAGRQIDDALVRIRPGATAPRLRALSRALAGGQAEQVLAVLRSDPNLLGSADGVDLEIRALASLGRPDEALRMLRSARGAMIESRAQVLLEIDLLTPLGDDAALRAAFERLRGNAHTSEELTAAYRREAAAWKAAGRSASALAAYGAAYRISGVTSLLRDIAHAARQAGDPVRARHALAQLCRLDPADSASCAASSAAPPP